MKIGDNFRQEGDIRIESNLLRMKPEERWVDKGGEPWLSGSPRGYEDGTRLVLSNLDDGLQKTYRGKEIKESERPGHHEVIA